MITIYHNPRCSKSRASLALVQEVAQQQKLALHIVDYLQTPPDLTQLQDLLQQLGGDVQAMLRDNEEEYAALCLAQADPAAALAALASHPRLLQRPIISYQGRAVIARPPELLLSLFQKA